MRAVPNRTRAVSWVLFPLMLAGCGPDLQGHESVESSDEGSGKLETQVIEARRVWRGGDDYTDAFVGAPSPDGRLISVVDWGTGDLAVLDLEADELRQVTQNNWAGGSYAEHSVFSPDGERIAYSWGAWNVAEGESGLYEVRTISLTGEEMRILLPGNPSVAYPRVHDWSRDGSRILLTVSRADRTSEIGLLHVESGRYVTLEANDWRQPRTSAFSPDGRFVAYDFPPDETFAQRDIFALATDGSSKATLVEGPGHERLLGWLPDGSGVLFHRQTEDSRAIWKQPVRDGRPVGDPQLVKSDVWEMGPIGFSRDAFYYRVAVASRQLHTVPVDLARGRALAAPEPVVDAAEGGTRWGAWSPDATRLAYLLWRAGWDHPSLVVESLTGEVLQNLTLLLSQARRLRWTERGFLVYGTNAEGLTGLFLLDPETAEPVPQVPDIRDEEGTRGRDYEVSAEGEEIYYMRGGPERSLVRRNLLTGERRVIVDHVISPNAQLSLSADGKWVSYQGARLEEPDKMVDRRIMIAPTDGSGEPRELYRYEGRTLASSSAGVFAPDGRSLLLVEFFDDERGGGIYQLPLDGSAPPELLVPVDQGAEALEISPDGRRLLFRDGENRTEIWRLTGLEALGPIDGS